MLALAMSLSLTVCVNAQGEENIVKAQNYQIADMLENVDNWIYGSDGTYESPKFKKDGEAYIRENKTDKESILKFPTVSTGEKFADGIVTFDAKFNFTGEDGKTVSFNGFQLRAKDTNQRCWTTDDYCILLKPDRVEFQVWKDSAQEWLLSEPYEMPQDERVTISVGSVELSAGIYIFIKINDDIIGVMDYGKKIKEEGYFNIEFSSGMEIYPSEEKDLTIPVIYAEYDAKNQILKKTTEYITTGEEVDKLADAVWQISTEKYENEVFQNRGSIVKEEAFEELYGENSQTLLVNENDIGKYFYCKGTTENGVNVIGCMVYVDAMNYVKDNAVYFAVGFTKGMAKGKSFVFDENNPDVYVDTIDDVVYVPMRGVMEALGYKVWWDGNLRKVFMDTKGDGQREYDTSFIAGQQGYIDFLGYMSGSMLHPSILMNDRTYLDLNAIADIMESLGIIYDEQSGLCVITKSKIELNSEQIMELMNDVY